MTGAELDQLLKVMDSLWPQANVIEKWGPGMALMCGDVAAADALAVVRDMAAPAVGPAPAWPPAPGQVRVAVDRMHERRRVAEALELAAGAGVVDELEARRAIGR